ncbi:MAG: hypothetical protein AAF672_05525 [Pseudomonadota bacterium]
MNKGLPTTGAIMMDEQPRKRGGAKAAKASKSADAGKIAYDGASSADASKGTDLNPYCNCNPCKCSAPCKCGLEMTIRETSTEWHEVGDKLVYTIVETWEPKASAKRLE